jgi:hypothetical protein
LVEAIREYAYCFTVSNMKNGGGEEEEQDHEQVLVEPSRRS